ncbi:MAG: respiratory nitrate reductase subunit gamma [Acidobacteriia bacterium]|nr:respiratory nitrate reductase subunit gamma [Terriglobia bacterium]
MKTGFLFVLWPYLATAICLAGFGLRRAFARGGVVPDGSGKSEAGGVLYGGGPLRISLLLLLLGHLAGLVFPRGILLWNNDPTRLYTLEGLAFAIGLAALAGWAMTMRRHLGRYAGSLARQVSDGVFLSLLFVAILSGLLTAAIYRWGSSWGALTLTPYGLSLLRGDPAIGLAAEMPFLVQLHVFSSFAALAVLPFTRLAPTLIVGLGRWMTFIFRPISVSAERSWKALVPVLKRSDPSAWIWPEED